ncbi:DinB family protein [Mucilaginibacter sp. UR6-1]|uniref:DinB family protein n=1 Tax=Mucilaginibacter sp. UR6-1 TaxID=1435643 RepID=UPI001E51CBF4|nr:DinB family protein [Mucilaginibacter sp. UR6-1]MCC8409506.1 DinB family protein [Mucilaginibacter sp. UR6-1]
MISKPQPDEYAPQPGGYINLINNNEDVLEILQAQTDIIQHLFYKLSNEQAMYAYAEGKWTLKQVLGHLTDTDRVFSFRAFCFARGQAELPGFDQDVYVNNAGFNSRSIQELTDEFIAVRKATLCFFRSVTDEQQTRRGIASGHPITVRALAYAAAGHVRYHLNLLSERYGIR